MSGSPNRKLYWLVGVAALLALANAADFLLSGEGERAGTRRELAGQPAPPPAAVAQAAKPAEKQAEKQAEKPAEKQAEKSAQKPAEKPAAKAAPARAPESVEALRERLAYLRSVEHAAGQIGDTYARLAIPYAEAMSVLPTFFARGKDPKASLEAAIRGVATQHGLAVDSLLVAVPEHTGQGIYQGVATLAVHVGDSEAMLRFLAGAARPGTGMVWNGFQLSADAQKKQLSLAGELRALLVESAE